MSDKPIRCLLDVRKIPLEFFKHSRDGRKWRQPARNRYNLLLTLASYANPNGNLGPYSPTVETLIKHYAKRTLYLHLDDLQDLGFLSWVRNQHYYRREYQILLPEAVKKHLYPDSFSENRARVEEVFASGTPGLTEKHLQDSTQKQVQDSDETGARLEQTGATVAQTGATATHHIRPPSKEPSKERQETPSLSDSGKQNGCASRTNREQVADDYFVWLSKDYRVSFGKRNKTELRNFIVSCSHSLAALKQGTARILDDLDLTSSYTHADNRLVASLPDACPADIQESEEEQRKAAIMAKQVERQEKHLQKQAAIEQAELEKKLAAETELQNQTLALLNSPALST